MTSLRNPSARPTIVTSQDSHGVNEPLTPAYLGQPNPWGRARVLYALPLDGGMRLPLPPKVVQDQRGVFPADPGNVLVGKQWVWIPRMLAARFTEDTRRIGG